MRLERVLQLHRHPGEDGRGSPVRPESDDEEAQEPPEDGERRKRGRSPPPASRPRGPLARGAAPRGPAAGTGIRRPAGTRWRACSPGSASRARARCEERSAGRTRSRRRGGRPPRGRRPPAPPRASPPGESGAPGDRPPPEAGRDASWGASRPRGRRGRSGRGARATASGESGTGGPGSRAARRQRKTRSATLRTKGRPEMNRLGIRGSRVAKAARARAQASGRRRRKSPGKEERQEDERHRERHEAGRVHPRRAVDQPQEGVPPGVAVHRHLGAQHEHLAPGLPGDRLGGVTQGVVPREVALGQDAERHEGQEHHHEPSGETGNPVVLQGRSSASIRPSRRRTSTLGAPGEGLVVGHQHDGRPLRVQLVEERRDLPAGRRVEVARRLVGEEEPRRRHQGAGDGGPLRLSPGELRRAMVGAGGEAHPLERARARGRHSAGGAPS